jgi:hypothetical protein
VPSPGRAFIDGDAYLYDFDDMIGSPTVLDSPLSTLVNDYVWAGSVYPTPVVLDYTWLVQPLAWRPVPPVNSQSGTRTGAGTAYTTASSSTSEYGLFDPGVMSLDTALDADPKSYAVYATTYQPNFLQRPPMLTFDLLQRSKAECWRILSVTENTRIILTGTPSTWPAECVSLFVDGVAHAIGLDQRIVAFTCNPLIGQAAGEVGPWFRADTSIVGAGDVVPF